MYGIDTIKSRLRSLTRLVFLNRMVPMGQPQFVCSGCCARRWLVAAAQHLKVAAEGCLKGTTLRLTLVQTIHPPCISTLATAEGEQYEVSLLALDSCGHDDDYVAGELAAPATPSRRRRLIFSKQLSK